MRFRYKHFNSKSRNCECSVFGDRYFIVSKVTYYKFITTHNIWYGILRHIVYHNNFSKSKKYYITKYSDACHIW